MSLLLAIAIIVAGAFIGSGLEDVGKGLMRIAEALHALNYTWKEKP